MRLVRFDPFRSILNMQQQTSEVEEPGGTWTPVVDIFELADNVVIRAEVAGLDKDDVDISVDNNTLTIRGERKLASEVKQESFHRIERAYGTFVRQFTLPPTVDAAKIAAEYKNGVLTVTLPVREEAKPRSVKVEVAA